MKKEKFIHNARVILLGILSALEGTAAVVMVCSSVILFIAAASDYGYFAVLDFLLGIVSIVVSILFFLRMGNRILHVCGKGVSE